MSDLRTLIGTYVLSLIVSVGVTEGNQVFTSERDFLNALGSAATTIDFDDLPDRTVVNSQYAGLTFSNASVWDWTVDPSGGSNVTPPNNLFNTDLLFGGVIGFVFDQLVHGVGVYNTSPPATDRVRMTLFDSQDSIIFQGELPETEVNFLGYIGDAASIARGEAVGIPPTNGFIFLDNFSYGVTAIVRCDFNSDSLCDVTDLDLMQSLGPIAPGIPATGVEEFDLNGDQVIDLSDRDLWLADAAIVNGFGSPYKLGDANIDGVVDGQDFIAWNAAKFTSDLLWSRGNFNADGFVDGQDFILWNSNKFTSSDDFSRVPEPAMGVSLALIVLLSTAMRRHRIPIY